MPHLRKIIWQGNAVGFVNLLGAEMWRLYGHWYPNISDVASEFVSQVERTGYVEVLIETDFGTEAVAVTDISEGLLEFRKR